MVEIAGLGIKAVVLFSAALITICAMIFLPAGTLNYWPGWLYIIVIFVPAIFILFNFLKNDPELLERRFKTREKEAAQKTIIRVSLFFFIIGFIIPGLDWRFGWSHIPSELIIVANALVLIGYVATFLVLKQNSYAARTIEVEKNQKVISTGAYSVVRHPMYLCVLLMYLATPVALGSYWAILPFLSIIPVLIFRIFNEEEVLRRELPGYPEYCEKTRYRLIPYVW